MSTEDPKLTKTNQKKGIRQAVNFRWAITSLIWTIVISVIMQLISSEILGNVGIVIAFLLLAMFILVGIMFDIIGMAVASSDEGPFHSMASRRVTGAVEAVNFIRNADKVSSFCNDIVGDISGIISGATAAVIVNRISAGLNSETLLISLLVTGVVSGLTVGGKALGKGVAIAYSKEIVLFVGKITYLFKMKKQ